MVWATIPRGAATSLAGIGSGVVTTVLLPWTGVSSEDESGAFDSPGTSVLLLLFSTVTLSVLLAAGAGGAAQITSSFAVWATGAGAAVTSASTTSASVDFTWSTCFNLDSSDWAVATAAVGRTAAPVAALRSSSISWIV